MRTNSINVVNIALKNGPVRLQHCKFFKDYIHAPQGLVKLLDHEFGRQLLFTFLGLGM